MTVAALEIYQESFRKLVNSLPECWHLCAVAEDRCRAEHFPRLRRVLRDKHAKGLAPDYDESLPWISVMQAAAEDDRFWDEQVRRPATLFLARGGQRGQKRLSSQALEGPDQNPNGNSGNVGNGNNGGKSKRQKKLEKKIQAEARKLNAQSSNESGGSGHSNSSGSQGGKGGGQKGGGKGNHPRKDGQGRYLTTREGSQICFAFNLKKCTAPCPNGRAHVCQYCLQGHRSEECSNRKGGM